MVNERIVVFLKPHVTLKEINMTTKQICLSNNPESKIYVLAKVSEDLIRKNQTTLLLTGGSEFKLHLKEGRHPAATVIESKLLATGHYSVKLLLEEDEMIEINEHNFNKSNYPVRNFRDQFILKKVAGLTELVRVYDKETTRQDWRANFAVQSCPSACVLSNRKFFEHLVGEDNEVISVNCLRKLVIRAVKNKVTKGSIYNAILYKFNSVGDCRALASKDISTLKEDDIVIAYSASKSVVKFYMGTNPESKMHDILKELELCGQTDFYIRPIDHSTIRTSTYLNDFAYVEPVLVKK